MVSNDSFVDPRQSFGPDKVIPPTVLSNAKGLAIITVLKACLGLKVANL
jgi:lipid-binding SYLF domain-containing protein